MKKNSLRLLGILAALTLTPSPALSYAADMTPTVSAGEVSGKTAVSDSATANTADQTATTGTPSYDQAASVQEQLPAEDVGKYGMVPIYGFDVKDGTYSVEVDSSSSMFRVIDAQLTVKNGEMSARITLSGTGYSRLYPGTGQEAAASDPRDYIDYTENEDGKYTYEISVPALNKSFPCAGFSHKKQKWYDRNILFDASSLPEDAISFELPDYDEIQKAMKLLKKTRAEKAKKQDTDAQDAEVLQTEADLPAESTTQTATDTQTENAAPATDASSSTGIIQVTEPLRSDAAMEIDLEDGEYSIEMYLEGGSGKATVVTPNVLTVKDGRAYATIQWSSSNYDYMVVGNEKYLNLAEENANSTFQIPITAMDEAIPVIGDTTAMGDPHEVSYTLMFFRESIGSKSQLPQEAAKRVLLIAFTVIIIGGILNHIIKKKNRA